MHGTDGPGDIRRLALNRETLHDLEPTDDETALVRGGDCVNGQLSRTPIVGPIIATSRFEEVIDQPGDYRVRVIAEAEFTVLDDQQLIVKSINHIFEKPEGGPTDG